MKRPAEPATVTGASLHPAFFGLPEPDAELQDGLRVDLAGAALGHAEHVTELRERQPLVVVEGQHEALSLRNAVDRVGEEHLHLVDLNASTGSCRRSGAGSPAIAWPGPSPPAAMISSRATRPTKSTVWSSGTRVRRVVDRAEAFARQVRVDLRGGKVCVPEQLLHGTQVGAPFEQVGRERVAERVWMQCLAVGQRMAGDDAPRVTGGETS